MTAPSAFEPLRADFSRIDPRAVAMLAERWARRHLVVPVGLDGGTIIVATSDPLDLDAERAVAFATGQRVRWVYAPAPEVARQLDRVYPEATARRDSLLPPVQVQHLNFGGEGAASDIAIDGGASVIRLVDQLLAEAISAGVSDLHLEPEEQGFAVRHRVDGMLRHVRTLPRSIAPSLVSRVKILSALDIADRMRPQDGRARIAVLGTVVDLRVSTLPASHGEKIVIRVLDGTAGLRSLESIGFNESDLARIRSLLDRREGLVLVTGPTGSGKTTTLYAALREVQSRGVNVVTVEDPIEYRLPGIVQVQVHERAGLTFGAALRSIMRQDPDVILVGEIRDKETAEIAIQASLTGHLVLSTLHTNDAASAVSRLVDIGVAGHQIATALKGVVAQRLLRRTCTECTGAGCEACDGSGYRGRRAIVETLISTPEFERRVAAGAPTDALGEAARAGGCITLWESGLALVRRGETTIDELRRVAAPPTLAVNENAREPTRDAGAARILWLYPDGGLESDDALCAAAQLQDARAALSRWHDAATVDAWPEHEFLQSAAVPACAAVIVPARLAPATRAACGAGTLRAPLIVALCAADLSPDEWDRITRDADVLLPFATPGRIIVANILALLRWRGE